MLGASYGVTVAVKHSVLSMIISHIGIHRDVRGSMVQPSLFEYSAAEAIVTTVVKSCFPPMLLLTELDLPIQSRLQARCEGILRSIEPRPAFLCRASLVVSAHSCCIAASIGHDGPAPRNVPHPEFTFWGSLHIRST